MGDFIDMAANNDRSQIALDIGNTYMKVGLFRGEVLLREPLRLTHDAWDELAALATNHKADILIYSSVANEPSPGEMNRWAALGLRVVALTADLPLPFRSRYRTMSTLGPDRIAGGSGCPQEAACR